MKTQLILLSILLIIGVYELIALSRSQKKKSEFSLLWNKSMKNSKLFEKGMKKNKPFTFNGK